MVGSETVYNVKQIVSERYERMAKDKHLTYIFANNDSNVITVIDNQGNQVKYEGEPKTAYLLKEANRQWYGNGRKFNAILTPLLA